MHATTTSTGGQAGRERSAATGPGARAPGGVVIVAGPGLVAQARAPVVRIVCRRLCILSYWGALACDSRLLPPVACMAADVSTMHAGGYIWGTVGVGGSAHWQAAIPRLAFCKGPP